MALLSIRNVFKSYFLHGKRIDILRGVSLDIQRGELVSLVGASGAGKSTFLHVLGTLDAPAAGEVMFEDRSVFSMNDAEIAEFRNQTIGFVFQSHFLLPEFTALENVAMPALIRRQDRTAAYAYARELLERVGLGHRVDHRPGELSGGEAQRVALARALVLKPAVLLADEPTGNLDEATGRQVLDLLEALTQKGNTCALVVTHEPGLVARAHRVLTMEGGRLVEVEHTPIRAMKEAL